MPKRLIIAGGGTGGHIFPAVAIAGALKKARPDIELLFVGAKGKMEMEKIPQAGYRIEGIDIAGFDRSSLIRNIRLPYKLLKSFFQVRRILSEFRADGAIGVGGYSTVPVLRLAQMRGIPTFIHESNAFAGKANIFLGKRATKIFVAADGMEKFFPAAKTILTGNPVRQSIAQSKLTREEGLAFFGLDAGKTTVFVTGGSLGAKSINEAIDAGLGELADADLQLIWQTGKGFVAQATARAKENDWIRAADFISNMEYAYAAADVIVSRSGSTLYELCVVGKPALFVPYPYATEDHQLVNAQNLVNRHAAWMIRDADVKSTLISELLKLVKDGPERKTLGENMGRLAITDADTKIAAEILKAIDG